MKRTPVVNGQARWITTTPRLAREHRENIGVNARRGCRSLDNLGAAQRKDPRQSFVRRVEAWDPTAATHREDLSVRIAHGVVSDSDERPAGKSDAGPMRTSLIRKPHDSAGSLAMLLASSSVNARIVSVRTFPWAPAAGNRGGRLPRRARARSMRPRYDANKWQLRQTCAQRNRVASPDLHLPSLQALTTSSWRAYDPRTTKAWR